MPWPIYFSSLLWKNNGAERIAEENMHLQLQSLLEVFREGGPLAWGIAAFVAIALAATAKTALRLVSIKLRKVALSTENIWDDLAVDLIDRVKGWVIFLWLFLLLVRIFEKNEHSLQMLRSLVVIGTVVQFAILGYYGIKNWKNSYLTKKVSKDNSSLAAVGLMYAAIQGCFFITIILFALGNLGIDIGALLAGLGVGGIAVALAAQNVLGDLLASLSIVLDKPFLIGDFIVVGDQKGTVEYIGIKTTRLRSLSGEELVFSNKDLLESRVQNYKRMWERRVVYTLGLAYPTPLEKMKQVSGWIKAAIDRQPKLRFDRCNFCKHAESALEYEFVYWVKDPDFNIFMNLQEEVLFEIHQKLASENVEIAFPTRTVYLRKEE